MIPNPLMFENWKDWASKVFQELSRLTTNKQLPVYSVAALPAATACYLIYVPDETGGAVVAFSDGTNWRRVTDRAVVS